MDELKYKNKLEGERLEYFLKDDLFKLWLLTDVMIGGTRRSEQLERIHHLQQRIAYNKEELQKWLVK